MRDISGQRFGRLVALKPAEERKNGYVMWACICDCGNTAIARSSDLRNGRKSSCGCLSKERAVKKAASLSGQRFGRLVALKPAEERKNGYVMWECICDCGKTTIARSSDLRNGHKLSCGCLSKELAAEKAASLVGQRFGRLVALRPTEERKREYIVWECKCDCGETVYVPSTNLMKGSTKSCGCLYKETVGRNRLKDLTGKRFGKLVVLGPTEMRKQTHVVWECKCDCGNTVFVSGKQLTVGSTESCGCLQKESVKEKWFKDLTGLRFGRLVAMRPTEERKNGFVMWECQCDCGNTVFVRSGSLISGNDQSCGCLRKKRKKKT